MNEESGQEQQSQAAKIADMMKNVHDLEQSVHEREQVIWEQNVKLKSDSRKLSGLEQEIELLRKQLGDLQRIDRLVLSEADLKNAEALKAELELLKRELASLSDKNIRLEKENQMLKTEKSEAEIELQQIRSRNYEHELQNLRKTLELSETAREKLQADLINAHQNWQLLSVEQCGKSPTQTQSYFEEYEREKKTAKELLKKIEEKELDIERIVNQNNELVIKVKQAELHLTQKEQAENEIQRIKVENLEFSAALSQAKEKYFKASEELIKQQTCSSEQQQAIKALKKKLHSLEKALKNALAANRRLETMTLGSHSAIRVPSQNEDSNHFSNSQSAYSSGNSLYPPLSLSTKPKSSNDEISRKIEEFTRKCNLPIKFVSLGDETYSFGTRKVNVKLLNGKLVIKIGGGYMFIEQFVKMYSAAELNKLSQMKDHENGKVSESENSHQEEDDHNKRHTKEDLRSSVGFESGKEIEDDGFADTQHTLEVARSSPQTKRKKKTKNSQVQDGNEASNKQTTIVSQYQEKSLGSKPEISFRRDSSKRYDGSHTATETEVDKPIGGRKNQINKGQNDHDSPKARTKKSAKKDCMTHNSSDLSRDGKKSKSSADIPHPKYEKSPGYSALSKGKLAQANTASDISPLRRNLQQPDKKAKEVNSSYVKS